MGIPTIGAIVAAFVSASIGVAALMRNYKSRLCASFAALAFLLFLQDALGVFESFGTGEGFNRIRAFCILGAGPVALVLLQQLVHRGSAWIPKKLYGYIAVCCVLALSLFWIPADAALIAFSIFSLIPSGIWLYTLDIARKGTGLNRERIRLNFAFWGGLFALVLYLTDLLQGVGVPPLGSFGRTFYLLLLFQLFILRELLTFQELVVKTTLFGSVALIFTVIYALLVSWVGSRQDLFYFNTLIASFVMVMLFESVKKRTSQWTRKLIPSKNTVLEDSLKNLSSDLLGEVDPFQIANHLTRTLSHSLGFETSTLFLLDREGLSYLRVGKGEPRTLPASSPLVEYMGFKKARPFVLESILNDRDSFYSPQARLFCESAENEMRSLHIDFILPFVFENRILGFFGAATGERFTLSNAQLELLRPLSQQVGQSLKNAQSFTTIQERKKLAALGEMAAALAHEIKNPLGAIKGAADLLSEGRDSEESHAYLDIIRDESNRLSAVLSDFLDYSRPRADARVDCNPLEVVQKTSVLLQKDKPVQIDCYAENKEIRMYTDPEILKQILINLFLNAIEAMHLEKEPKIEVRLREIYPKRPWFILGLGRRASGSRIGNLSEPLVEIEIADLGQGIPEEERSKIFQPFYTTKPTGTGLGLAICQRLVEGMGGTIQVRSNAPRGSRFVLHLPLKPHPLQSHLQRGSQWQEAWV